MVIIHVVVKTIFSIKVGVRFADTVVDTKFASVYTVNHRYLNATEQKICDNPQDSPRRENYYLETRYK